MKDMKSLWRDSSGSITNRVSLFLAGALLLLVVSGAVDETIRHSGLAWAEQIVHGMGF